MTPESAESLALRALAHIVGSDELCPVFLGSTGATLADVRTRAGDAEFLASVLDFLTMDDAWVIGFCDAESIPYDRIMQARAALPGGEQVNWT